MPPLKRAVYCGKKRVVFNGGPWNKQRALLGVDVISTGTITVGKLCGEYQDGCRVEGFGRKHGAPYYVVFNWLPAPMAELQRALQKAL
jgi:hypothetical protein